MDDIVIQPIKVRDLPAFLAAIEPALHDLSSGDILGALARHADGVLTAVQIATGVERSWLDQQTLDVLCELIARVIEVNAGFLASSLARLSRAIQDAATACGGTGGLHAS